MSCIGSFKSICSYSERTELLFDLDQIMKDDKLSEEQKVSEFLKLRLFHEKPLQILANIFDFLFYDFWKEENEIYNERTKKTFVSFLKEYIDWLCPNTFQKKCVKDCWF